MKPNKSLGQHWLRDQAALEAVCRAASLEPEDFVLEIGPGQGALTRLLTKQAGQVLSVEIDPQLASELSERVPADNLQVLHGDILKFDLSQLPAGYKVVANVPYYITSAIIKQLLTSLTPPGLAVLLVQKEVAQRLAAQPGKMGVLSVSAQIYAQVSLGQIVTAEKFDPPPKVDSQIVVLKYRPEPLFKDLDYKLFFRVVKAGFGEKRKTLQNSLSGGLQISKETARQILAEAGVDPASRAESLSLEQWYKITKEWSERTAASAVRSR